MDGISKFIKEIRVRLEADEGRCDNDDKTVPVEREVVEPSCSKDATERSDEYGDARAKAERAVIEPEQYKATLAQPQGISVQDNEYFDS